MRSETMQKQVGGNHYNKHMGLQAWDIIDEYKLNFYEASALKYLLRDKGDRIEDLQKMIHYAEKEIENLQENVYSDPEVDDDFEKLLKDDEHQENIDKLNTVGQIFIYPQDDGTPLSAQ